MSTLLNLDPCLERHLCCDGTRPRELTTTLVECSLIAAQEHCQRTTQLGLENITEDTLIEENNPTSIKAPDLVTNSVPNTQFWKLRYACLISSPCSTSHLVKDVRSKSRVTRNGAELLWNGRDLTTKWEQPWPQLVRCALIDCRTCGCVFQEDWIVVRNLGEEWYRLIGVRIGQGEDINDFNLQTKELGCNYWSTYTKSGIGGVPVTSPHHDPIGVDNRSLGAKN